MGWQQGHGLTRSCLAEGGSCAGRRGVGRPPAPREEVGGRGGGQQPVPPPQTVTERCLLRGRLVPGAREQGGTGYESGCAARWASRGGGLLLPACFRFCHCRPVKQRMGKGEGEPLEAAQLCCPLSLLQLGRPLGGFWRPTSGKGLSSHSVGIVGNRHTSFSSRRSLCTEVELVTRFLQPAPSPGTQGPAKWREKATESGSKLSAGACC